MDRLGVGWAVLREINPRLIYVAVSGFGHSDVKPSPYTQYPAFDIVAQALSGLMYRPQRQGNDPIYLGFSLGDIQAAMVAIQGTLLALLQRGLTGKGQKVDISLYDATLVLNELPVTLFSATGQKAKPGVHAVTAPFGAYQASDGHIVIAVLGEHVWRRFCEAIGQPQLVEDERFATGVLRQTHLGELNEFIRPWLAARTRDQAVQTLLGHGVPASNVNDVHDIFECPHVAARDMLVKLEDPVWGPVEVPGNPIKMSAVQNIPLVPPPRLGEHNQEVLAEWLGAEDAAALQKRRTA
jgi:formyl-CoA transferase